MASHLNKMEERSQNQVKNKGNYFFFDMSIHIQQTQSMLT